MRGCSPNRCCHERGRLKPCADLVRGGNLVREGGNLVQGTLRGAPCAGSPRALWDLEVSQSKKPGKTPRILHFVNITNQMHGFVINLPSSNLKMCTTLNPLAPGPRKWRLKHATLKIDCVYFINVAPIMGSVAPAIKKFSP